MFFRRQLPHEPTFDERLPKLRELGFAVAGSSGGKARVTRDRCAAEINEGGGRTPQVASIGVLIGGEIGLLVDKGFQKTFRTPGGKEVPALASHLTALHGFVEDLREGLGLTSLYNLSLGTTNDLHLYDRVEGRDAAPVRKPWERTDEST